MKKGLFLLLITFLFTFGPSFIQVHAKEITKPEDSLELVANNLTTAITNVSTHIQISEASMNHSQVNELNEAESSPILLNDIQPQNEKRDPLQTADSKPDTQKPPNSGTLLSADLNLPLAGNVKLDMLSGNKANQNKASKTELAGLETNNSALLGKVNVGLLSNHQVMNGSSTGSIAYVDLNNKAGVTHVGIIETNKAVLGNTLDTHSGLIITDLKNSILGDAHLGIGEWSTFKTSTYNVTNTGLLNTDIDNSLLGSGHLGLVKVQLMSTGESTTETGGSVIIDLQNSHLGKTHIGNGEFNNTKIKPNPSFSILINNPKAAYPVQPALSNIDEANNDIQQQLNKDSSNTAIQRVLNEENNSSDIGKITIPISKNSSTSDIQMVLFQASTASGSNSSGSESGGGGSTSSSSGSGAAGLFDDAFQKDLDLKNSLQFIFHKLSDEWIKAPPINPPQETFFLLTKNLK